MKKVGICTVYTGYNYGSALQAIATKHLLHQLGYDAEVLKLSGSIVAGRDIRLKKILILCLNILRHFPKSLRVIKTYTGEKGATLSQDSRMLFASFYENDICPHKITENDLKKEAKKAEYVAFLCGSDQVWNSSTYYVDPFYYLTFAPEHKRIAFAPSFGRDYIPAYNKKKIGQYISAIPRLSIREQSGKTLIADLFQKDAEVLLDPTLLLDAGVWKNLFALKSAEKEKKYVLAYFLNEPSAKAKQGLNYLSKKGYKILSLPYERSGDWFDECLSAGPKEFLQHLLNAEMVFTDSFHGTAFSLNFQKNFCVFERNYGSAGNQSSRITSLLNKVRLNNRFDPEIDTIGKPIDFTYSAEILKKEKEKAKYYLLNAIKDAENV